MMVFRSLLFNAAFFAWTALCTLALVPRLAASRRTMLAGIASWAAGVSWLLARTVGIDFAVRGRQNLPDGPALVAAKHQSAWETVVFHQIFDDLSFVVKKELLRIPLYGRHIVKSGSIAVDRQAGARGLKELLRGAQAAVGRGQQLVVFPEGTRSAPGEKLPYQPGIAALYARLGLPVVPVALNSGLYWGRRSFIKRPGRIVVEFLPPIPAGLERAQFMAELEQRIETASAALIAEDSVEKPVDNHETNRLRTS